jgi:hypothetical protein
MEVGSATDCVSFSSGSAMKSLLYWQCTDSNGLLIRSVTVRIIDWISHRLVHRLIRWLKDPQATRSKWDSAYMGTKVSISMRCYWIYLIFYYKIRDENKHRAPLLHWSEFHSNWYRLQYLNIDYVIIFGINTYYIPNLILLILFTYPRMYA